RSPRPDVASNSLNASIPVSGVRMSWAKAASAVSIARGEWVRPAAGLRPALARRGLRAVVVDLAVDLVVALPPPVRPNSKVPGRSAAGLPPQGGSAEPDHCQDLGGGGAARTQLPQSGSAGRFRQLLPFGIENQAVMMIDRLGKFE